uniref:Uveal autoantigen with coiled-coil domains and ankyrin repeats n=1 Tax=Sphenodon punctatus TaxID=8508 RepID=A0A8D0G5S8_SPHPU
MGGGSAASGLTADWNKYDDRLMKAAERGDVEKVLSVLAKKVVNPTKLDVEGRSGNLDCLNTILVHGVDILATDAAGRNALHLAAKYGHALCLQKLLQYNCPTENVDLQGRTALHDAAMSDCPSSIQLLSDHGALVNAKDADGRTPLVLATQMCRPAIVQLLLDRGADIHARDKQNRTALMLGCEYGCRDAVDVLLKNGADVSLVDALGHDSSYYARIGDNIDILALIKSATEECNKGTESHLKRSPLRDQGDLETENDDLRGTLREVQQEHRMLLERINALQLQLNEEQMVADDLENEKDELRGLLAAKEKQEEESLRTVDALKSRLRFYEVRSLHFRKEDALLKQSQVYTPESQHMSTSVPTNLQSRSMLRPLELSLPSQSPTSENEILKRELDSMRQCYETAKGEISKLQTEMSHKVAEGRALSSECDQIKRESDQQIKQLEDALKDVQKRMFDSEGKVKQMQTHFLALKDHLTHEAATGNSKITEELKDQLKEMKAKYEGVSAEVGKLRNQIKQNELLVAEFKRDEARLVEENKRLQKERGMLELERGRKAVEMEGQVKEMAAKLAFSVSVEKFESMKSLLSGEVNEKARTLAESEREYEKLQAEVRFLKRELEGQKAKLAQHVRLEEHEEMRGRYEQKAEELGKTVSELTLKSQALQRDVERVHKDNKLVKQQLQTLKAEVKSHYVPLKMHEDMKKASDLTIGELTKQLAETMEKSHEHKAEVEKLLEEKTSLRENVSHLRAAYVTPEKHEKETAALKSTVVELKRQLAELIQNYDSEQAKVCKLVSENATMRNVMNNEYVPVGTHNEIKAVLNSTLEKTNQELSDLKEKMEGVKQEFVRVSEENGSLKKKLRVLQNQVQTEYISIKDHEDKVLVLNKTIGEVQGSSAEMLAQYQRGQEEILQLHDEIAAQKKELDTIQECIKSKYAPVASFEETEQKFDATVKDLEKQLLEQTQRCRAREEEVKKYKQENEKLKNGFLSIQNDLQQNYILAEKSHAMERMFTSKMEDLNKQLRELLQKYTDVKHEKERLQEDSAKQLSEALAAQNRMQGQYIPLEQVEILKKTLGCTIEDLQGLLNNKTACYEQELQKVRHLQQELADLSNSSIPLTEHAQIKEAFAKEISAIKASLREKEEESQAKSKEISRLQSEIQNAKQALKELESRDVVEMSEYKAVKSALETQVSGVVKNLANLNKKYEAMCEEASRAKKEELSAKDEKELLQLRSQSIEQEIKDQKERYDKSLTTITDLQKRIQESAKQVEAKDNKITELLNDVERLKQALNGLSQLTHTSGAPSKRQNQQVEVLQNQVKTLQQQLADAERQHQEVISIYRTHLLSAVQGHMDEDVQAALLQIIRMRQGLVCS